jgi:metal-responsive CopG/Arc/MetJ family transcriptional regulator
MTVRGDSSVKVTVSLAPDLLAFADRQARRLGTSRSQLIGLALAHLRTVEEEQRAAQGYRFYSSELSEFAEASAGPTAEAITDGSPTR